MPREQVPALLAARDALVNNMRAGAPDKVVYEAAATCLPVLASNPVFAGFLPDALRFPREDARRARRPDPRCWRSSTSQHIGRSCASGSCATTRSSPGPTGSSSSRRDESVSDDGRPARRQGRRGSPARRRTCSRCCPDLRERGWDARFCLLHEDEPGAWEFAGAPRRRRRPGRRRPAARATPTRSPSRGCFASSAGDRPAILHTHLVHADAYGLPAGKLARVPVLASTKHGFNAVPRAAGVRASATGRSAALARPAHRDLRRSRPLPRRDGGLRPSRLSRSSTTGSPPGPSRRRHRGRAAAALRRPARPDQGPRRRFCARFAEARGSVPGARARASRATVRCAASSRRLARRARARATPSASSAASSPVAPAYEGRRSSSSRRAARVSAWSRSRRPSAARAVIASAVGGLPEIVDDGRTGVLVPAARRRRARRRDRRARVRPRRARAAMGAAARERALSEFSLERCADRTDALYRAALERAARAARGRRRRRRAARARSPTAPGSGSRPAKSIAASVS